MQGLQKAQENFEQAQQEVMQAQTDLEMLMQEAPLPVMPAPQVNVSLVKSLEALTGLLENVWNPIPGPPPDSLIHAIHGSSAILQTSSGIRRVALLRTPNSPQDRIPSCGIWKKTKPRRWQTSRRLMLQVGRLSKQQCQGQSSNREYTDNTAAEEDTQRSANGCGAGWSPVLAGPKVVSTSYDESQRHGTFGAFVESLCDCSSIGTLHRVSMHRIVDLLQHAPGETLASLL